MKILIVLTSLFLTLTSFAATEYQLAPKQGKVEFKTKGWPNLVVIKGVGQGPAGALIEDNGKISGQISFDLTTLDTGIALRDDHMKKKYLEITQYPTSILTLKDVSLPENHQGAFHFTGLLNLHGVEKEVSGQATLNKEGDQLVMSAKIPVKLSEFNIAIPNYKGITVAEDVKVDIESKILTK